MVEQYTEVLEDMSDLQSFIVLASKIGGDTGFCKLMSSLSSHAKLTRVCFAGCGITDDGICTIFRTGCTWPSLKELMFGCVKDEEERAELGIPPDAKLTDASAAVLAAAIPRQMPSL